MPFPDTKRSVYRKNQLERVVCQLRFPPILRIETSLPADFQERIRSHFPQFTEGPEIKLEIPAPIAEELPAEIVRQLAFVQPPGVKSYEFASDDAAWKVSLTRTFLALSTPHYLRWEHFKEKLSEPLAALIQVYSPEYFSRIGLRYVNVIRRSALGLTDVPWHKLIEPYLAGLLGYQEVGDSVRQFESTYLLELEDKHSSVRIATKFVTRKDDGELCFRIDSDFFTGEKTVLGDAVHRLDYFNKRSSRLIRWSITDLLHEAMEPQSAETE